MDTKWKKWKNRVGCLLFFLGMSGVVLCAAMFARQITKSYSMYGHIQFDSQLDYQELDAFHNYINERFETCMEIANGTYINWDLLNEMHNDEETTETVESAYAYEADISQMSPEELEAFERELGYDSEMSYPSDFTEEEKKQMAERCLEYEKKDLNVLYQITNNGTLMYSNMENQYRFGDTLPVGYNYLLYFDGEKVTIEKDGKKVDVYGNGIYDGTNEYSLPGYSNYEADSSLKNVTITLLAIKTPVDYRIAGNENDSYYYGNTYSLYRDMLRQNAGWQGPGILGILGILLLILSMLLCHQKKDAKQKFAAFLNKIWIEPKILLLLFAVYSFLHRYSSMSYCYDSDIEYFFERYSYSMNSYEIMSSLQMIFGNPLRLLLFFWILYLVIFDISHNGKKQQNGIILLFLRGFHDRTLKMSFTKRQIRRVSLLSLCAVSALVLSILGGIFLTKNQDFSILFLLLASLLLIGSLLWYFQTMRSQAKDLEILNRQIELISRGNYDLEDIVFSGKDFEQTENHLSQIQDGIKQAIDDQLKSERMKVDLVANVSHDLKTPLTSIISYIQFLKEEETLPEHVKDYIRILDEKSNRLNEIVQDVFSISKATSGQLPVNVEVLDFGKLLNQTLADMAETISRSSISIKSDIREHEFFIEADGQKMYRVCQNLIQNALKYSLDGSRMFITLEQVQNQAVAAFKNTSKAELDQSTDFTARFVRGDKSRTDGGSGLGLSIAKSFTEACGGHFEIDVNGDMFVVTVSFDRTAPTEE